ncbi:hypothetical protein PLICRDRAFT_27300 [Plicaturopsis crispa FD-325 SS-3]|nr:hypothetical protein PLICRDRAFT_27300 [Plicaturopsis crispa FD-325 SS-3]
MLKCWHKQAALCGRRSLSSVSSSNQFLTWRDCEDSAPEKATTGIQPTHSTRVSHSATTLASCSRRSTAPRLRGVRRYSSAGQNAEPVDATTPKANDSIFSRDTHAAWDHVFDEIDEMPPLVPSGLRPNRNRGPLRVPSETKTRRQKMTAREINAFDEMFNMIFNAASKHETGSGAEVGIGTKPHSTQMDELYGKLRRHSKKTKWTTDVHEQLDRKKEEMDLCDTDQQLLEWAMREVFGESTRYEEAARKAIQDASEGKEPETMPMLQPPLYPHLVAHLMRTFRDKYHDPHLALSMFDHARHLSIPSYVFGCTTPAYNELIETRWTCFRDLKGVHDALEEMAANGVEPDNHTRKIVEALRREVGERNLWQEESELGSGEVYSMLAKIDASLIEHDVLPTRNSKAKPIHAREAWKREGSQPSDDGWQFGRWDNIAGARGKTRWDAPAG